MNKWLKFNIIRHNKIIEVVGAIGFICPCVSIQSGLCLDKRVSDALSILFLSGGDSGSSSFSNSGTDRRLCFVEVISKILANIFHILYLNKVVSEPLNTRRQFFAIGIKSRSARCQHWSHWLLIIGRVDLLLPYWRWRWPVGTVWSYTRKYLTWPSIS